jgi:ABC-type branched-subunit amino acid transport system ATPase component
MLRIENLRAGYRGSDALHSVSIQVARGAIVAVVGANGAGKSTLINAVSRLVTANSGAILFEGENIVRLGPADAVERGISNSASIASPVPGTPPRCFVGAWTTYIRCSRSWLSAPYNARAA